jgi:hypothetical protein
VKKIIVWFAGLSSLLVITVMIARAWGWAGHIIVNRNATIHLPDAMQLFKQDSDFFDQHSGDADLRINYNDTSFYAEWPKHYFAIDDHVVNIRTEPHNLDSLIRKYGWNNVKQDGIIPWATVWALDSLTSQLARGDMSKAELTASDLGHYVADGHQPLRCTVNNNGQFTGNSGINFRYEFEMMRRNSTSFVIVRDSVRYIASPIDFIFDYFYHSYSLIDSVLASDNYAKTASGWDGNGSPPSSYYDALWEKSNRFTRDQMQRASVALANLWYTAWVNAGLLNGIEENAHGLAGRFSLKQNYPNPFNPVTNFQFTIHNLQFVSLKVFDVLGNEVATLVNGAKPPGSYEAKWDASDMASGVYLYRLQAGTFSQTKKMLLLR